MSDEQKPAKSGFEMLHLTEQVANSLSYLQIMERVIDVHPDPFVKYLARRFMDYRDRMPRARPSDYEY